MVTARTSTQPVVVCISFALIAMSLRMAWGLSAHVWKSSFLTQCSLRIERHPATTARRMLVSRSQITMMPEGPEVRTLVDQLQGGVGMRLLGISFLSGRYTRHGEPTGYDDFSSTLTPLTNDSSNPSIDVIREWNAKGKFIYLILESGKLGSNDTDFQRSIWVTLGMSGRFVNERLHQAGGGGSGQAPARWCLDLLDPESGKQRSIYYYDARNFGTVKFSLSARALEEKLNSLGPDILERATDEDSFLRVVALTKNSTNICKFLMNQSKLSGIGNYILAEGLYRAGVDPFASLEELDDVRLRMLFRELKAIAAESYQAQGLSRQSGSYRDTRGERGRFEFSLQCYGREYCARGKPVVRETNGPHGRTIWYTAEQLYMPVSQRHMAISAVGDGEDQISEQTKLPQPDESVDRLLSGLTDPGWKSVLSNATNSASFLSLAQTIETERREGKTIYPPEEEIFSAFNLCPFAQVRVVIVGQDPYHGPGQGHGLAFSVQKGIRPPPSLQNIFKEAMADVAIDTPCHGHLKCWAEQGVLLLNTALTVREGQANSHSKLWTEFTDEVIATLNTEKESLVFLLWGNPAAKKARSVNGSRHTIIKTSHPSPLGATKTTSPFLGSRCFSFANEALVQSGNKPIDWNVI